MSGTQTVRSPTAGEIPSSVLPPSQRPNSQADSIHQAGAQQTQAQVAPISPKRVQFASQDEVIPRSETSTSSEEKTLWEKLKSCVHKIVQFILAPFRAIAAFFKRIFCGKPETALSSQPKETSESVSSKNAASSQETAPAKSRDTKIIESWGKRLVASGRALSEIRQLITQKGEQERGIFKGGNQNIRQITVRLGEESVGLNPNVGPNFCALTGLYYLWKVLEQEGNFVLTQNEAPRFIDCVIGKGLTHAAQSIRAGECDNFGNTLNEVQKAFPQLRLNFSYAYPEKDAHHERDFAEAHINRGLMLAHLSGVENGITGFILRRSLANDLPPYFVLIKKEPEKDPVGYLGFTEVDIQRNGCAKGAIFVGSPQEIMDFIYQKNREEVSDVLNTWFIVDMQHEPLSFLVAAAKENH